MSKSQDNFSKIYDDYINKIYRFIFLKVNSQEIAEDLCSETFLRCWETFKKNENKIENIQAFLYQIARNLVTDHYRGKARVQLVSTEFMPIIDPNPEIDLKEKSFVNSDIKTIRSALANLKEDYQNIIICHYIDDLSISETADILEKSQGAVRVMLHRALKALKNEIREA